VWESLTILLYVNLVFEAGQHLPKSLQGDTMRDSYESILEKVS